jgi:hypothetical protein
VLTHRRLRHTTLPHLRLAGAYPLGNVWARGFHAGLVVDLAFSGSGSGELGWRVGRGQAVACR